MIKLIVIVAVMSVCIYFRVKFDREYTMPVIRKNKDLSFLNKVCLLLLSVAIIFMLAGLKVVGFWLLILMIPFVLYFNLKVYGIAIGKFFKKNK